jgi:hypothetical protein
LRRKLKKQKRKKHLEVANSVTGTTPNANLKSFEKRFYQSFEKR